MEYGGKKARREASTQARRRRPNRLIKEKSPYLLQHAYNPVDWHPWGEEAFERAKREDKPVFVSSGYSSCHWCHVMEQESYDDPQVAERLNEAFIPVKVDREERPDIDNVLVAASELLTGAAGWPLNIIMTPEKKPFFAATYIPKESHSGLTGMLELIWGMKELWRKEKGEVIKSAEKIASVLKGAAAAEPGSPSGLVTINAAYMELTENFDHSYGGFGVSPKFPAPHNLTFLLRYFKRTGSRQALRMAEKTLTSMRLGGIYDHVGFGFHRYSTDREWLVPHFEKMLYDQALLSIAYTEAYQVTKNRLFEKTAKEILAYVLRDMTSPGGGFYSAEDADSEGREGKFYLWKEEEIKEVLGSEADFMIKVFNVRKGGNFSDEAAGEKRGENILHMLKTPETLAAGFKIPLAEFERRVSGLRERLFSFRGARVRPYKDDKILTDWNGLMIAALSMAGKVFDSPVYRDGAKKAAGFILDNLFAGGALLHRFRDGDAAIAGNLNDYACLTMGLLELFEATFEAGYLKRALELNNLMTGRFWDSDKGAFYFADREGEELLFRQKESLDHAIPSGNSLAMANLLRIASITGRSEFAGMADTLSRAFSDKVIRYPSMHTAFLSAVDFALGPSYHVVVAGGQGKEDTKKMMSALRNEFIPNKTVIFKPEGEESPYIASLLPELKGFKSIDGKAAAYVCAGGACQPPVTSADRLLELLRG
ncbi:MAG: thioredoxin domain-containing protein [Deltaproteobacteria bacterium]|nr:thioredoxin domain-containing protein [Deltaproteobacteria bacterium]